MNLVLALRESNPSRLAPRLAELGLSLIRSRYEALDPALRNLIDGLYSRGLALEREGQGLCWCLVESERDAAFYVGQPGVAVCFDQRWLQQQCLQIRYLKGIAYCDAAAAWAALLPFEAQPAQQAQAWGLDWCGTLVPGAEPAPGALTRALPEADLIDEDDDGDDPFNRLPASEAQAEIRPRSPRPERNDRRPKNERRESTDKADRSQRDAQSRRPGKQHPAKGAKGQQDGRKQRSSKPVHPKSEQSEAPAEPAAQAIPVLLKRRARPPKVLETPVASVGTDAPTDEEQMDMFFRG